MDTKQFLNQLKKELLDGGLDSEQTASYTHRFYNLLKNASPEEEVKLLTEFGNPSDVAANILTKEREGGGVSAQKPPVATNSILTAPPPAQNAPSPKPRQPKPAAGQQPNGASQQRPAPHGITAIATKAESPSVDSQPPKRATPAPQARPANKNTAHAERHSGPLPINYDDVDSYKRPMTKRGNTMFWWVMGLSSPITIAVAAAVALFIGALYAVLAGLVAISTAVIIAGVLVGLAISIVGLIFGGAEIILESGAHYVGLYEISIALMIIGAVTIGSILLYNIITKLVPLLWGLVTRLAKLIFSQFMRLVYFVREECNKRSLED